MKVAIKAKHGKEVIKYLESIGGKNVYNYTGTLEDWLYYIQDNKNIEYSMGLPYGYTLIELPKNNVQIIRHYRLSTTPQSYGGNFS